MRLALPGWVTDSVNRKLADMGEYRGQVGNVALHLWRGAYSIEDLQIEKRTGKVPVPLLNAPRADLTVSWPALLHGAVEAKVTFESPEINFVDAESSAAAQSGKGVNWRAQLEELLPIRLDEVLIHNGTVHFRNFTSHPKVDLLATAVEGRVLNLSNARNEAERAADLEFTGTVLGDAALQSTARFDPLGKLDDFNFSLKIDRIELQRANDLLQAYVKVDVESGQGDFLMELEARDGQLKGYAKPLFRDVRVFSWKQDVEQQGDNPLRAAWEVLAGVIEDLFKNQRTGQFATRVEIQWAHRRYADQQATGDRFDPSQRIRRGVPPAVRAFAGARRKQTVVTRSGAGSRWRFSKPARRVFVRRLRATRDRRAW